MVATSILHFDFEAQLYLRGLEVLQIVYIFGSNLNPSLWFWGASTFRGLEVLQIVYILLFYYSYYYFFLFKKFKTRFAAQLDFPRVQAPKLNVGLDIYMLILDKHNLLLKKEKR